MWCVAPEWPEHGRHVAVEFVHPVIVGKRALPAVSVDDPDPVAVLRAAARPGDVLLAIGRPHVTPLPSLVQRAGVWGLATVWIGAGERPGAGAAHHVLWLDGRGSGEHDGRLALVYHVLWELTHVCFEHPGLLRDPAPGADPATGDDACPACTDEGRLGEIVATGATGLAEVRTERGTETVDTTVVEPVRAGDLVLVHAGIAIARVEPS